MINTHMKREPSPQRDTLIVFGMIGLLWVAMLTAYIFFS